MLAFRGYYGSNDGEYALYVVGTNGCSLHRLTGSIAGDPSWSPDANWIAFDTSGEGEIWKVHPHQKGLIQITGQVQAWSPAWSPDGKRIAFVRNQPGGGGQIWVMSADGSMPHLLHEDAGASDQTPAWSHDGTRIAFAHAGQAPSVDDWIEVMNADGSHVRTLTKRSGSAWNPVWLPGDAGIAFLSFGTNGEESLFVMRSDGSHHRRLASLQTSQFAWANAPMPQKRC